LINHKVATKEEETRINGIQTQLHRVIQDKKLQQVNNQQEKLQHLIPQQEEDGREAMIQDQLAEMTLAAKAQFNLYLCFAKQN
jgi:ATP phosphoribosyltransferase